MKLRYLFLASVLLIGCSMSKNINKGAKSFADNIVVAHRGAWKKNQLPENSIAALKQAIALGCTGSEFDVRMTADDSLIINHDPDYNKLVIEKSNYAELVIHKLSNGEKLPTLREYLLAGLQNNTQTRLVLEIKPSGISKERARSIAEKTVKLVHELNAQSMTTYISFDYDILLKIHELDAEAATQYLEGNKSPEELNADGISGADYHYSVFTKNPKWIDSAKKNKIILNAWTVNAAGDMDRLLEQGFDLITTNEPELLFERIRSFRQRKK